MIENFHPIIGTHPSRLVLFVPVITYRHFIVASIFFTAYANRLLDTLEGYAVAIGITLSLGEQALAG